MVFNFTKTFNDITQSQEQQNQFNPFDLSKSQGSIGSGLVNISSKKEQNSFQFNKSIKTIDSRDLSQTDNRQFSDSRSSSSVFAPVYNINSSGASVRGSNSSFTPLTTQTTISKKEATTQQQDTTKQGSSQSQKEANGLNMNLLIIGGVVAGAGYLYFKGGKK